MIEKNENFKKHYYVTCFHWSTCCVLIGAHFANLDIKHLNFFEKKKLVLFIDIDFYL